MELRTINEVIPGMKTGSGIFTAFTDPIWNELFSDTDLDIFFAGTYGQKYISPYTDLFVGEDGKISNVDLVSFANAVYSIRASEWEHLYNDLVATYNPIENTDVTEAVTENRVGSGTNGNTRTLNTTSSTGNTRTLNTRTDIVNGGTTVSTSTTDATNNSNGTGSNTNATSVYGFDSSTAVDKDSSTGGTTDSSSTAGHRSSSDNVTTSTSGYNTDSGTIADQGATVDTGTVTDAGTDSHTDTFTRSYTKHGNIGIMTNVQLLRDDTDYWRYWSFIKTICEDICDIIALDVY